MHSKLAEWWARQPSLQAEEAATHTLITATGAQRGCRGVGTSYETLPVPGSIGAGPSLLGPPLIQGCLLSLAQITEAGRTHELQPAKSPHGQMCVCAWQLQIHHPVYTHTHAAGAAAAAVAAMWAVPSVCCSKKKLKKKRRENQSLRSTPLPARKQTFNQINSDVINCG